VWRECIETYKEVENRKRNQNGIQAQWLKHVILAMREEKIGMMVV
jgi:hypothetical protein